jgi:predicted  nucleic acid-binding Zn-ribbon protein
LKQQQNLYEAVRSDRQLFSKNLLEATEEIAELRQKYKLLSQQLCQLKEEIQTKEKVHQNEDKKKTNFKKENAIL